ncbi:SURF1 family protein [Azorhizobium oxalatiphilum]|uniref:SURF1 family protein n=1 Tax=Azorhizobium oxalatiphilum TaxID=980631 RepID=UPI0016639B29|nr:SURF1 family protein [Azorhizobium oxalatiphilum]
MIVFLLVCAAITCALGIWQVERRTWKLDLIARVDARIHAPPVAAPGPADWPAITAANSEYLKVQATGRFLNDKEVLVQAVTDLGGGFWLLVPFRTDAGFTLFINRGFVPPEKREAASRAAGLIEGETRVTGLLRMSEPHGGFLRTNDPAGDRWYSRDVAAMGEARGVGPVAPYFVDADATLVAGGLPVGGLTVVRFPNSHLVYLLTWFAMCAMALGGAALVWRRSAAR